MRRVSDAILAGREAACRGDGAAGPFPTPVSRACSGSRDWRDAPGFDRLSVTPLATAAFPPAFVEAGKADPLLLPALALAERPARPGVAQETLFRPADQTPPLGHECQVLPDTSPARDALATMPDISRDPDGGRLTLPVDIGPHRRYLRRHVHPARLACPPPTLTDRSAVPARLPPSHCR